MLHCQPCYLLPWQQAEKNITQCACLILKERIRLRALAHKKNGGKTFRSNVGFVQTVVFPANQEILMALTGPDSLRVAIDRTVCTSAHEAALRLLKKQG